jgi:hypothetical protein
VLLRGNNKFVTTRIRIIQYISALLRDNKGIEMASIDNARDRNAEAKSVFARLALPFMFNPDLGPAGALFAVIGALARIFGACLLFAFWGGFSAWAWTAITNHFWRMAAVGPLVLIFPAALASLLLAISAVETRCRPRH